MAMAISGRVLTSLSAGILTTALLTVGACERPHVGTTLLWERRALWMAPADLDGDSTNELVVILNDYCVAPMDQKQSAISGTPFLDKGSFELASTMCGACDGDHVWATSLKRDSLFVFDVWQKRRIFVASGRDIAPPAGWNGAALQVGLADLDSDGDTELVTSVGVGFDLRPRGVFVNDWKTGRSEWTYLCGPNVTGFSPADLDLNGTQEVLCWTQAPGNGNAAGGTDDSYSYVFALNCDGSSKWLRPIGRYASEVRVLWFGGGEARRRETILACEFGGPAGERSCDSLFMIRVADGDVVARTSHGVFYRGCAVFRGGRNRELACLTDDDDTLRVVDTDLRVVRKLHVEGIGTKFICAGRFVKQAGEQVAVVTTTGVLLVYDTNLRLVSRTKLASGPIDGLSPLSYEGQTRLLTATQHAGDRVWALYAFERVPSLWSRRITVGTVAAGSGIVLLLFVVALVHARYQRTRDVRATIRSLTGRAGVVELDRRGEVTSMNQRARELLGKAGGDGKDDKRLPTSGPLATVAELARGMLAESGNVVPKEMVVTTAPGETKLARCVKVKTGAVLTIEDISAVEYLQRVKAWAPVAQKLAHGIKNPLGTIMGAVEQFETEVNRRREKSEAKSQEPKAKTEDGAKSEARGERLEAGSAEEGTGEEVKGQEPRAKSQDEEARAAERVKKYIGYVKDEVARLKKMTDAFMHFTRLNPPELRPKDVNVLVREVLAKYEGALAKGISLEMSLDERLPPVALDEEGIGSVLDIVIENAIEAMPVAVDSRQHTANRALKVRTLGPVATAPGTTSESGLGDLGVLGGSSVRIEVTDTGVGIPEKYLDKVFEPYFTHGKPAGTGLGLALAKKMVEDHKGRMEVRSKEGAGTTVTIVLPAAEDASLRSA